MSEGPRGVLSPCPWIAPSGLLAGHPAPVTAAYSEVTQTSRCPAMRHRRPAQALTAPPPTWNQAARERRKSGGHGSASHEREGPADLQAAEWGVAVSLAMSQPVSSDP